MLLMIRRRCGDTMMKARVVGAALVFMCGLILMGIGLYFIFFRPALLPEDVRFIRTTADELHATVPGFFPWLQKVFWVLGGYIFTTGLLTCYVARTLLGRQILSAIVILEVAGITSIGWMVIVNVILNSDFKWLLLVLALLWGAGLVLMHLERRSSDTRTSQSLKELRS
jgi:hypothetical protein